MSTRAPDDADEPSRERAESAAERSDLGSRLDAPVRFAEVPHEEGHHVLGGEGERVGVLLEQQGVLARAEEAANIEGSGNGRIARRIRRSTTELERDDV